MSTVTQRLKTRAACQVDKKLYCAWCGGRLAHSFHSYSMDDGRLVPLHLNCEASHGSKDALRERSMEYLAARGL